MIIPRPSNRKRLPGHWSLQSASAIAISHSELRPTAHLLQAYLAESGREGVPVDSGAGASIALQLRPQDRALGEEGYSLTITDTGVTVTAAAPAGVFYAVQSLHQLMRPCSPDHPRIACTHITDIPQFGWRGLMLDESRHFFGKDYVLRLLDMMGALKLNRFHWHLTDEPAWRIAINQYPKLTEIGGRGSWSDPDAPAAYYSQDDIREIVAYAQARHIVIIPEIDMPGHATAANRAYPEHSGGGSERCPMFTFNPGKEETYSYLAAILREVVDLFPGPWLHFGGDEVCYGNEHWHDDPQVQARMAAENLTSLDEMERYFSRRMAKVIRDLGKIVIGWDEVVRLDLPPDDCMVDWWRHDRPEVLDHALSHGYRTVLCPRIPCYFDFIQDGSHVWGRGAGEDTYCTLEGLYAFPDLSGLDPARRALVQGIQACTWTERMRGIPRLDFMLFPRLFALAEAAWTPTTGKDFADFTSRLKPALAWLADLGFGFYNPFDSARTPEVPGVDQPSGEALLEEELQAE